MNKERSSLIENADPNIVNEYYRWLCGIVDHRNTHSMLLHDLHNREFYYILDRDENRAKDGKYLRYEFGVVKDIPNAELILAGPCSILEMLIGLAGRFNGAASLGLDDDIKTTRRCFWIMMDNLGLKYAEDQYYDPSEVHHILDRWLFREYDFDGKGGLFPLDNPSIDQREVEIWKQKEEFLLKTCAKSDTL